MSAFARLLGRRRRFQDISVSIDEHIQERADELVEEGLPRPQAEQQARREFGNVALAQERSREVWQWAALESILADAKLALRRLRRTPGFAFTVLLTLAVGIGANTAVFTVLESILLKPLPYPDSGRLAALWLDAPGAGGLANFSSGLQLSTSMYLTFADHNQTFQSLGIWTPDVATVTGIAVPEEVRIALVSDGVLETLAVPPRYGRWFNHADQDPHGQKSVILGYGYWQRRFGGNPAVIGRTIQVDAQTATVVGVMPRGFRLVDHDFDLLVPLAVDRSHQILAGFGFNGIGRLKPGVTLEKADADIARLIPVWMNSWTNGLGTNPQLGQMLDLLEKQPRWNQTMLIVQGDHSWRTEMWRPLPGWSSEDERISHGGEWDPRPLVMIHAPGQQSPATVADPTSLMFVHDTVAGEIRAIAQSPAHP
jgi:hypothetical protein